MESKNLTKEQSVKTENFEIEQTENGVIVVRVYDKIEKMKGFVPTPKIVERVIERIAIREEDLQEIKQAIKGKCTAKRLFEHVSKNPKYIAFKNRLDFIRDDDKLRGDNNGVIIFKVNGARILFPSVSHTIRDIKTLTNRMFGNDKVKNWQLEEVVQNLKDFEAKALECGKTV